MIPDHRKLHAAGEIVIAIPVREITLFSVPVRRFVFIADHAGFERGQRVEYLEGRGRQVGISRTLQIMRET